MSLPVLMQKEVRDQSWASFCLPQLFLTMFFEAGSLIGMETCCFSWVGLLVSFSGSPLTATTNGFIIP